MNRNVPLASRLEFHSMPEPNSGCQLWLAAVDPRGYGVISIGGRKMGKAHRMAWAVQHGPIPQGLQALHKCDVRACVNPDHLWLGTQGDNMNDMVRKGRHRQASGERNSNAILTEAQVREIRSSRDRFVDLASRYGVSPYAISDIFQRRTWRHVL